MRVLLLSRYGRLAASSRIRSYQYIPYLEARGVNVTVSPLLGDGYVRDLYAGRRKRVGAILEAYLRRLGHLLKSHHFDLLWIEKELLPWLPAWGEMVLEHRGIPYVVDYDDAVFHRYDLHPKSLVRSLLGRKIDAVMRRAALVVVGNDYLADRAMRAGAKRVEYLPSVVDLDRYRVAPRIQDGVFTVGWIGSPGTSRYLSVVRSALAQVLKNSGARLVLVGSGKVQLEGVPVVTRPWSEATEVTDIQSFDVGVMPLPDEPWERGKSGYKLIQYMACSLPVVASPVGVNQQIIEDGVNGFLADSPAEWAHALLSLRDNPDLRTRMGRAGRLKVEAEYCLQATGPRLVSLLRRVVEEHS